MSERPVISPELVAALVAKAPRRLVRKLDATPDLARAWSWEREGALWLVSAPKGDCVRLSPAAGCLSAAEQVRCSCLLTPRCLHVLAVVMSLELAEDLAPASTPGAEVEPASPRASPDASPDASTDASPAATTQALSSDQLAAAEEAWRLGATLLVGGAAAAGALAQADLLRVVHGARVQGLHRLAASGLRLSASLRDRYAARAASAAQTRDPSVELATFLGAAWALRAGPLDAAALGQSRRAYSERGHMRLWGVLSEPVLASEGMAGVVTTFVDANGLGWSLANVRPGPPERARGAYELGAGIGGLSATHKHLCRRGLVLQGATASAQGRLGSGAQVRAAEVAGAPWQTTLESRLRLPLSEQARAAGEVLPTPAAERRAGCDLLFARGIVLGRDGDALILALCSSDDEPPSIPVRARLPARHSSLPSEENLRLLGCSPGLSVTLIGRCDSLASRNLTLLALGPWPETERTLVLPPAWEGRCNLGFDALEGAHLSGLQRHALHVPWSDPEADPLAPLARRLRRLALGGRATVAGGALRALDQDRKRLAATFFPTGAHLLAKLAQAATGEGRRVDGTWASPDLDALARAFLAAATYRRATRQALWAHGWESTASPTRP